MDAREKSKTVGCACDKGGRGRIIKCRGVVGVIRE